MARARAAVRVRFMPGPTPPRRGPERHGAAFHPYGSPRSPEYPVIHFGSGAAERRSDPRGMRWAGTV
ncbi:hypothetical protein ADK90_22660 [Streptomyces sp. XY413]|nr:hypothetical protein ADK90_22660 [Streptomyces sp. XY413]